MGQERWDAVVVGAGLAGLVAALDLLRPGRRVLVLERRDVAGGLCGTVRLDGYEFVVACNDFGIGLERILARLGVDVGFRRSRTRFQLGDARWELPLGARGWAALAAHAGDLWRLLRAWPRGGAAEGGGYLGPLLASSVRDPQLADLLGSLGYPLGLPPHKLPLQALRAELSREHGYGYERPTAPVGGPAALVAALVERLHAAGGALRLGTECQRVEPDGEGHVVCTRDAAYPARVVLSSEGRWDHYPRALEPGLAIHTLHLAVRRDLAFPPGVHTLVHLPPGVAGWMAALDAGRRPAAFGFHLFRSHLPAQPDHYALNAFFYMPRGIDDPAEREVARARDYLLEHAERLLPGLGGKLLYERYVSPKRFRELHGLSSRVSRYVLPAGFRKPDPYDPARGVFCVGNSVGPPGEHAGAAVLSGLRAARLAAARLKP